MKLYIKSKKYPEIFTEIDDEDFDRLSKYKWHIVHGKRDKYIARYIKINGKRAHRFIQKDILNIEQNIIVDHINHNPLNNRKENLRICTRSQNNFNRKKIIRKNNITKYKGVAFIKGKFISQINICGEKIYLGYYKTELDAALAYNKKALELFGEFAFINKLGSPEEA